MCLQLGRAPLRLLLALSDLTVYCINFDDDVLEPEFVHVVVRAVVEVSPVAPTRVPHIVLDPPSAAQPLLSRELGAVLGVHMHVSCSIT